MEIRYPVSPEELKTMDTQRLRRAFLMEDLFVPGKAQMVYSHIDRIIVGGAMPLDSPLFLDQGKELHAKFFLERRELGIINIGGVGKVRVDGKEYVLHHRHGLYIGRGSRDIELSSAHQDHPAIFYLNSAPAHKSYPTVLIDPDNCQRVELGSLEESNRRTITKYILPGQVESCQLVMGMTELEPGSVWNTMPCHTHDRRMEVYLYFDLPKDALVMHYLGEPKETRHLVVRDQQAVLSPSYSIHAASGTQSYTFIWGMVGENQDFDDMDPVDMADLY